MGGGGRGRRRGGLLPSFGYKRQGSPEALKHWVVVEKKSLLPFQSLSRLGDQPLLPARQLPTLGLFTGPLTSCPPSPHFNQFPLLDQAQEEDPAAAPDVEGACWGRGRRGV